VSAENAPEDGKDALDGALSFVIWQGLTGLGPRHVFDIDNGPRWLDPQHESECARVAKAAYAAASGAVDRLETACHELGCLEDEGLAGTARYLLAIASIAFFVRLRGISPSEVRYLRTMHATVGLSNPASSYDLSNAIGALETNRSRGADEAFVLGAWVWLNLAPADTGKYFRWLASSMRFADAFGKEAIEVANAIKLNLLS
jgi:hypothetical protein